MSEPIPSAGGHHRGETAAVVDRVLSVVRGGECSAVRRTVARHPDGDAHAAPVQKPVRAAQYFVQTR
ncbi:hypothetical protein [Saccharomonospora halophila]|uniref:hypothetical protein n=1 Tax=Saccharomonospora halophila TaxID=129922 RepID=UPI00038004D8|nr:hypothetical protein [Saccharomonospora halophila]